MLLRVLVLVALVVAPVGMISRHAAVAMPTSMAERSAHAAMPAKSGHCSTMGDQNGRDRDATIDCTIACASILPRTPAVEDAKRIVSAPTQPTIAIAWHGLTPAAEPPPPRPS